MRAIHSATKLQNALRRPAMQVVSKRHGMAAAPQTLVQSRRQQQCLVFQRPLSSSSSKFDGIVQKNAADPRQLDMSANKRRIVELYKAEKFQECVPVARENVQLALELFGEQHPVYGSSLSDLGLCYKELGQLDDAANALTDSVRVYRESVGPTPSTAVALLNLGITYRSQANTERGIVKQNILLAAKEIFEECVDIRNKLLVNTLDPSRRANLQVDVHLANMHLGLTMQRLGERKDAEKLVNESFKSIRKVAGDDHPLTWQVMNDVAFFHKMNQDFQKAEPMYRRALRSTEKKFGSAHRKTIVVKNNLAELLLARGLEKEANALQQEIITSLGYDPEEVAKPEE